MESKESKESKELNSILDQKLKFYTYITATHEPGTLIMHPDLSEPFDTNMLFDMDKRVVKEISIRDILEKGFIKIGDTDTMEDMDIEYPIIPNENYSQNKITGKHWDWSGSEVASAIGKNFLVNQSNNDYDSDFDDIDDFDHVERDEVMFESQLVDGKMEDIFNQIETCENTAFKDAKNVLEMI